MKKLLFIFFIPFFLCSVAQAQAPLKRPERKPKPQKVQSSKPQKTQSSKPKPQPVKKPAVTINGNNYTIYGVSFEMIPVEGGTFRMGSYDGDSDEKPVHNVTLSDYAIGKTEVTQALWKAVMGSNPSNFKGDNLPVESVNWNDCQDFISKLNQLTGKQFRLPTEAEWEYAARGGNRSKGYKYSGNNDIDAVVWYEDNSGEKTHPVGTKHPNELGIYNMSGNVYEWCQDWYGKYSSSSQTNPTGPSSGAPIGASSGSCRVHRGGGWYSSAWVCRASNRGYYSSDTRSYDLGLRLVLSRKQTAEDKTTLSNGQGFGNTYTINGVSFDMIPVKGGTFQMGATSEQGDDANDSEKPVHYVTLSDYAIGKTEVTQALWKAVMGSNPSKFKGDDNLPVESVDWYDCQNFIRKLNQLTGKQFRLPTEAEWEYAARGGNRSKGYKYSGNNDIDAVAWYDGNSGNKTHPVGTKQPNELGIYNMNGNVCEWCKDCNGEYSSSSQTNPTAFSGSFNVIRGGCWFVLARGCRTSSRGWNHPSTGHHGLGLRLVLSQ